MITAAPDNNVRVRIPNSTHPSAIPANDAGSLDANVALNRMILVLAASPDREHRARTLVDSQQTKGSPDYHHWVTPEEFGQNFGPAQQDIQQVTAWLQQQGFAVAAVAKSGRWIEFSGSTAQVNSAFQTQMRHYLVNGQLHTANASNISIPAALAPVVRGVVSLHDFYSQPTLRASSAKGAAKMVAGKPLIVMSDGTHALAPVDIAAIYNLNPLFKGVAPSPKTTPLDGTGQIIAIVAEADINTIPTTGIDDVANFRSLFGLPPNTPNIILTGPAPGLHGASVESTLDVEWSGSVAPKATIDLVESAGTFTTDPVDLSALYIVDTNLAGIMNLSFQQCEMNLGSAENAFWNALFEQAAAQGISVFVASGDAGAGDCSGFNSSSQQLGANGLSSTPFNTSVGGLQFDETINGALDATFWNAGNAVGYIPEAVWNDCAITDCGGAGGGGISEIYSVPSWQTLPILGLTGAHYPNRVLPDVSLAASEAHDPYVICYSPFGPPGDCQVSGGVPNFNNFAGGTSFASPELAGVMALIDQALGGRQGLANFQFYSLAAEESSSYPACNSSTQINPLTRPGSQCIFNDVTAGNNGVTGDSPIVFVPPGSTAGQPGYNAVPGYDAASGLGSINVATLVNAWVTAEAKFNGSATTLAASFNGTALPSNTVSVVHGLPVSVTVSVAALSSNKSQTPSTEVSLLAQGGNLPSNVGLGFAPISGSGGTATSGAVSLNNLPGGTNYNISAYFPGDGVFAGSTSNSIAVTVAPENTTTTLQAGTIGQLGGSVNPVTTVDYGDLSNVLAFNATVAGQSQLFPATGTVTFTDNGNFVAAVDLTARGSGLAQFVDCFPATPCLGLGQHLITATYSGDGPPASYNGSTSSSVTVTITKSNTVLVSVRVPAATAIAGQPVNLNTFILTEPGAVQPTGAIQFFDGTTPLGPPVPLGQDTNTATMGTFTADGNHVLTAQYPGDALYNAATSPATTLIITPPFTLTSASPSQTIPQGVTATFSLSLANSGFAGKVALACAPVTPSPGLQCTLPASETLAAATATVPFSVMIAPSAAAQARPSASLRAALLVGYGVFFAVIFYQRKERPRLMLLFVALALAGVNACGGGASAPPPPTFTTSSFTVTAASGTQTTNIALTLIVQK